MRFNYTLLINKNIDEVSKAFQDPEILKICQDGFKEIIPRTGIKGTTGATATFVYDKFELTETILENSLPDIFYAQYDHKHCSNTMKVKFKALAPNKTEFYTEVNYLQLNGIFMKVMAFMAPNFFKKQVEKWLLKFKTHLES